jgi:hypothetical protein
MEGTEHRTLGRRRGLGVVDGVDKQRKAEDVREKNELLRLYTT